MMQEMGGGVGIAILESTVRTATPLLLAALGETVVERAGVINIGLEGSIIAGAFVGLVAATAGGVGAGILGATAAGVGAAAVGALFMVGLRANQIITGTAVTMLFLGMTGALYRGMFGVAGAALGSPTMAIWPVPALANLPFVGRALFAQPPMTYVALMLVPGVWWFLFRTQAGLALRATGENPDAARAAGISVRRVRLLALLFGGAMGGLAGGTLVLAQVGTFAEGMSAGRGFIAVAIVALGRWHPFGVALAAMLFGAASALQFVFQALGRPFPYQLFLALPYALTLVALALSPGRGRAPARLGQEAS